MAVGEIPPWLNVAPAQIVQAGASGAEAGLGVARLRQAGQQHSAELAQRADQLAQQANADAARLSQQERIAQMETQARQEIAQQNRLREDQKELIDNAYKQAHFGLEKSRLEGQQAVAAETAKHSALVYAHTAGFTKYLAEHPDDPNATRDALALFPGAGPSLVRALKPVQEATGPTEVEDIPNLGSVLTRPGSRAWRFVPTATNKPEKLTPAESATAGLIKHQMTRLDTAVSKADEVVSKMSDEELATDAGKKKLAQLEAKKKAFDDARNSLNFLYNKPKLIPTMGSKQMADAASMPGATNSPAELMPTMGARQMADEASMPQTSTATNAPNPYQVGKRYGNLRYKGGDPNLESSWDKVQ